jgi:hypothetical protein
VRRPTDGAVLVALLAPVIATLDGNGATITVDTLYPFGDVRACAAPTRDRLPRCCSPSVAARC